MLLRYDEKINLSIIGYFGVVKAISSNQEELSSSPPDLVHVSATFQMHKSTFMCVCVCVCVYVCVCVCVYYMLHVCINCLHSNIGSDYNLEV